MGRNQKVLLHADAKNFAIVAIALIAVFVPGFLIGYFPSHSNIKKLEEQNVTLEQRNAILEQSLRIAALRGAAGLMSYRANQNNFGEAAKLSTGFFNGLRDTINDTSDEALKQNLQALLEQRDEITAGLVQADPAVKETLAQMYADFFQIRTEDQTG